jgi:hypothetical protein
MAEQVLALHDRLTVDGLPSTRSRLTVTAEGPPSPRDGVPLTPQLSQLSGGMRESCGWSKPHIGHRRKRSNG